MPLFQSLSFVINEQIRQNQIIIDSGLSLRSNVSQQLQIINTNKASNVNEPDVLRWGYANWGVEKVTSEYKPQEIK
jgi:hypothetical protein